MKSEMKVTLLRNTSQPEELIATAARLCYSSDTVEAIIAKFAQNPEQVENFVRRLESMGHESPFEHVSFTFAIEGVSRALTHQLVRHRLASYSQKSQRYVKEGQFSYIVPPSMKPIEAEYIAAMEDAQKHYDNLFVKLMEIKVTQYLEKNPDPEIETGVLLLYSFQQKNKKLYSQFEKVAAEDARYVLPNACETSIIVTMNVRTLWHFFHERCCYRAQWEIRRMANQMLRLSKKASPLLFKNSGRPCLSGVCPENSMQCEELKHVFPTEEEVKALIKEHWKR